MGGLTLERSTSRDTAALENRIDANNRFGSANLTEWLVKRLRIKPGDRLLDIGCGTGTHLVAFTEAGARSTGIDISPSSLDQAAAAGAAENLRRMDMGRLDEIDDRFEIITAIYSLYYSADAPRVLEMAADLLSPHGRLTIFGPYSDNGAEWFEFIGQFMALPPAVQASTTTFMFETVFRFAQERFASIECERFVNAITIPGIDELRRYWRSNIYYDEALDPAFEDAAEAHFRHQSDFRYRKVGQLIQMSDQTPGQ